MFFSVFVCILCCNFVNCSQLCSQVLDRGEYPEFSDPGEWFRLKTCRLHIYNQTDWMRCLDGVIERPLNAVARNRSHLHFHFIGDSRIRQQFFSFVQLFPDYDMTWKGSKNPTVNFAYSRIHPVHNDISVYSEIIGVRITFHWRPIIDEEVLYEVDLWSKPPYKYTPTFILMGISIHHMLRENEPNISVYRNKLKRLQLGLHKLDNLTDFVWFSQFPLREIYGRTGSHNSQIDSRKIEEYDTEARNILKQSGIRFWDSSSFLIHDYLRGCILHSRSDPNHFYNCNDYIHPGYLFVNQATQMLANLLCNKALTNTTDSLVELSQDTCCYQQ